MGGYAWVTLATNNSYSLGALVLAHSLKKSNTVHKMAVLITPAVSEPMREQLGTIFDVVKMVDVLDSKDEAHLALMQRPDLGITFTKIHCWRLTEFDKCVFLDADTLVVRNCDELFEREEFSAAPDVSWPDCFNSGVFVYRPSVETFNKLLQFAVQNRSFDGGDQGLLNQFFSDWATEDIKKHLPFVYNLTSVAAYSYIPAFKHYGSETRIVHFIGAGKPWLQQLDAGTRTVTPTSGSEHLAPLLQQWWDLFCEKVHPNLDKNLEYSNDGMSHPPVEANSLPIALTDEPFIEPRTIEPCTPYREKDDFRQHNLPYQPFNVKGSSGELLNVEFLLASVAPPIEPDEQQEQQEIKMEEEERPVEQNKLQKRESGDDESARDNEEETKPVEHDHQEENQLHQQEKPPPLKDPFDYDSFFPDETCINNYLEQNVVTYQPFDRNLEVSNDSSNSEIPEISLPPPLPRFLTIPENDCRQSGNSEPPKICESLPRKEPTPPREPTLLRKEQPFSEKRELIKSKSMPYLHCEVTAMEPLPPPLPAEPPRSIWKSQPDVNAEHCRKFSMPRLKPILPKQNSFVKPASSAIHKVTIFTEFLMSSEYKDPVDLPKDKEGFVETYIRKEAKLRRSKSDVNICSKFGPLPFFHSPEMEKPVVHKTNPLRNLDNEFYDLAQCKRQIGNKPKQNGEVRKKENVHPIPPLKPLAPGKDKKSTSIKKRKSKELSPQDGGREKVAKRGSRIVKDKKRVTTPRNVSTNGNDLDEILQRLKGFSKDYQHFFEVEPKRKTVKDVAVQANDCRTSGSFETATPSVSCRTSETQAFRQFRNYVRNRRETSQKGLLNIQDIYSRSFEKSENQQQNERWTERINLQKSIATKNFAVGKDEQTENELKYQLKKQDRVDNLGECVRIQKQKENVYETAVRKNELEDAEDLAADKKTIKQQQTQTECIWNDGREENERLSWAKIKEQLQYGDETETTVRETQQKNETTPNKPETEYNLPEAKLLESKNTRNLKKKKHQEKEEETAEGESQQQNGNVFETVVKETNKLEGKNSLSENKILKDKIESFRPTSSTDVENQQQNGSVILKKQNHETKILEKSELFKKADTPEQQQNIFTDSLIGKAKYQQDEEKNLENRIQNESIRSQSNDSSEDIRQDSDIMKGTTQQLGNESEKLASLHRDTVSFGAFENDEAQKLENTEKKQTSKENANLRLSKVRNQQQTENDIITSVDETSNEKYQQKCQIKTTAPFNRANIHLADDGDVKTTAHSKHIPFRKHSRQQQKHSGRTFQSNSSKPETEMATQCAKTFPVLSSLNEGIPKKSEKILCVPDFDTPRTSRVSPPTPQTHSKPSNENRRPKSKTGLENGDNSSPDETGETTASWSPSPSSSSFIPSQPSTPRTGSELPKDWKATSGIAGAIAQLNLEAGSGQTPASASASAAHQEYLRRQNWETGNMDYMGKDSFDNIWSKICQTLEGKEAEESVESSKRQAEDKESPVALSAIVQKCPEFIETLPEDLVSGPVEDDELIFSKTENKRPPCLRNIAEEEENLGSGGNGKLSDDLFGEAAGAKPSSSVLAGGKPLDGKSQPSAGTPESKPIAVDSEVKPQSSAATIDTKSQPTEIKPQPIPVTLEVKPQLSTDTKSQHSPDTLAGKPQASAATSESEPSVGASEIKLEPSATATDDTSRPAAEKAQPSDALPESKPQSEATTAECKTVAVHHPLPASHLPPPKEALEKPECTTVAIPSPPIVIPGAPSAETEKPQISPEPIPLPPPTAKTSRSDSLKDEGKQKKGVFTKILEMVGVAPKEKSENETQSVFYDEEAQEVKEPAEPDVPPRKNSDASKVEELIGEAPLVEGVRGKVSSEIEEILGKAKTEVENLLQDRRSAEKESGEARDLVNTMKLLVESEQPLEEVEELRVTTEEERKRHKGEPVSSKLSDQILKAIPPPRRKAISEASASSSAIPKTPEQKTPATDGKGKHSKPSSIPVPPPRSRGKPTQLAPSSKGKGKK